MKVFFFWERAGGLTLEHRCNPYAGLLARALAPRGILLEPGDYALERKWLNAHRETHAVLHLNWLHGFYRRDTLEDALGAYARFADNLSYARSLGYRIVWTMHNLYPHERPFPDLDRLARLLVCRLADAVIAHCGHAAERARRLFYRTTDLHVIPHGNFIDAMPNVLSRAEARCRLGISGSAFVYLFFGNARTYKGIEGLMEAFCRKGREDALLVLMMRRALNAAYADALKSMAGRDRRIRVFTSPFFPAEDFQIYLNAADAVALPFSEVLTSGSAVTALSFGKPVVVPRLGCLPELVDDRMGVLCDPGDPNGLENALVEIRNRDLEAAGRAALDRARELDWEGIATRVASIYAGTGE